MNFYNKQETTELPDRNRLFLIIKGIVLAGSAALCLEGGC